MKPFAALRLRAADDGGGEPGDPYFSSVSLLIDGTQGTADDLGPIGLMISTNASPSIVGSGGSGYLLMDSAGDAYYVSSDDAGNAFAFGTDDFTIECDIYRETTNVEHIMIDTRRASDSAPRYAAHYVSVDYGRLACYNSANVFGNAGTALHEKTWYRVALNRVSGTLVAYLDGVRQWTASMSGSYANSSPCVIGNNFAFTANTVLRMRHIRITKGVARYGNNATSSQDATPFATHA